MEQESKKGRFVRFIDQTLEKSAEEICKKVCASAFDQSLTFKLRIRDIGLTRYVTYAGDNFIIKDNSSAKVDCLMVFSSSKIIHSILLGKTLPYSFDLISKLKIIFFNEKGKILTSIYIPAKKNYCKIIKGTRFTLKPENTL
jgi:hypothetical protein